MLLGKRVVDPTAHGGNGSWIVMALAYVDHGIGNTARYRRLQLWNAKGHRRIASLDDAGVQSVLVTRRGEMQQANRNSHGPYRCVYQAGWAVAAELDRALVAGEFVQQCSARPDIPYIVVGAVQWP